MSTLTPTSKTAKYKANAIPKRANCVACQTWKSLAHHHRMTTAAINPKIANPHLTTSQNTIIRQWRTNLVYSDRL